MPSRHKKFLAIPFLLPLLSLTLLTLPVGTAQAADGAEGLQASSRRSRRAASARLKRAPDGSLVPDVRAAASIIYRPGTGEVIWEENSHDTRSIASITKVMTALVFLESDPDLSTEITVARSDVRRASTTYLRAGERLTLENVLHLALVASDNAAARALARVSALGSERFIERMNTKAHELGLEGTSFADPSGLDADNLSSAYDLSRLIVFAGSDERVGPIMRKPRYRVQTSRRRFTVRSTNKLIGTEVEVRGGKTGFIRKAGYCLAALLELPEGEPVAVVVLGARSNSARFLETRRLFNWLATTAQGLLTQ